MAEGDEASPLIVPSTANLSEAAFVRVEARAGRPCPTCDAQKWWLSKWQRGNGWCVDIQCVTCGTSGGQPFPKNEHSHRQTYPEFAKTRNDRWHAARREAYQARREAENARWQADYNQWLATSPDWAQMRRRVIRRANGICEACLDRPATEVHHRTYDFGWLPPAYLLAAVCRPCHERFRAEGDDWAPKPLDDMAPADDAGYPDDIEGEIEFD